MNSRQLDRLAARYNAALDAYTSSEEGSVERDAADFMLDRIVATARRYDAEDALCALLNK